MRNTSFVKYFHFLVYSYFCFIKNDLYEVAKADILDEIAGLAYHKKIEPAEWSVSQHMLYLESQSTYIIILYA